VIQDAVNDFSVPYHLMTAEYNSLIQRLLRPQGVCLLTVIDAMESGRFMASAVRTVEKSFGETRLLAPQETHKLQDRSVYVIAGRFSENVVRGPFFTRLSWNFERSGMRLNRRLAVHSHFGHVPVEKSPEGKCGHRLHRNVSTAKFFQ
jgi:hypothetical protein